MLTPPCPRSTFRPLPHDCNQQELPAVPGHFGHMVELPYLGYLASEEEWLDIQGFVFHTCEPCRGVSHREPFAKIPSLPFALRIIFFQSSLGQPKVDEVKTFLPFLKFVKPPQTKFHAHTNEGKLLGQKKSKFIIGSNFCSVFFLSIDILFETTTTDIDMLLQVSLQFCKNNELVAISDVIILSSHYWTIEYYVG